MTRLQTHQSPDSLLTFETHVDDDGDIMLGFAGFGWHTHGDLLVGQYGRDPAEAAARFIDALLNDRLLIELRYRAGELADVVIVDEDDALWEEDGTTVQRCYWSGATHGPSC